MHCSALRWTRNRPQCAGWYWLAAPIGYTPRIVRQWLNHAYEECLDQAVYLKRAMAELDRQNVREHATPLAGASVETGGEG